MTAPTRIDPVDWGDLCELALRQPTEAGQNGALMEIIRMIRERERKNAAEKETK